VYERWRAFASRFAAEWRKVVAGDVLLVVALVAHLQGWTLVYFVACSSRVSCSRSPRWTRCGRMIRTL